MLGLGWVPTLFVCITTMGYIIPYIISTSFGHVYYIFPAISDSGVHAPESLVFRELLNLSGFLSIMNIYVRHKQYKLILSAIQDASLTGIERLNFWCFVVGIIGGIGVTFIANFKSRKAHPFAPVSEYSVHNLAAVIVFSAGLMYCVMQTHISEKMITYGVNTRIAYLWRLALTFSIITNFVIFLSGSVVANLQVNKKHWHDHPELKLRWRPEDPGYRIHVISNVAEWIMCLSFTWFSLTFVSEFKKIRITSDFVEDRHRLQLLSVSTENSRTYSHSGSTSLDYKSCRTDLTSSAERQHILGDRLSKDGTNARNEGDSKTSEGVNDSKMVESAKNL